MHPPGGEGRGGEGRGLIVLLGLGSSPPYLIIVYVNQKLYCNWGAPHKMYGTSWLVWTDR